jgi:GTPase SAR1 family protein
MLVFDLTNPASFVTVTTKWYELAKARSPDAQLLLVGNKSDMETSFDDKQA